MHEIVILSGKGGSGKTSVTGALARILSKEEKIVICDYDVDAPDLHILLRPTHTVRQDFVSGRLASFNPERCIDCAQCLAFCRFDAISRTDDGTYPVCESACEGCAVCVKLCPVGAFDFEPRHCGEHYRSETRFGPFVHAALTPGAENSGRLITLLKSVARDTARETGAELILSDGTPGIGCPVISSLSGASLVCAVVEATASGAADFERLADLCRHFRLPIAVIINKADLHPAATGQVRAAAQKAGAEILGEVPFTPQFTRAMVKAEVLGETPSTLDSLFVGFARRLKESVSRASRTRPVIPIKEIQK